MLSRFFEDKDGNVVIWQWPNLPIILWFILSLAAHFTHKSNLEHGLRSAAEAFLITWAYLEIKEGASMFRRVLGAIVMIFSLVSYFK